jgi:hypothetical protein
VAQQLPLRSKRVGSIMEDYAWLYLNARISNAFISAVEDGSAPGSDAGTG